MHSQTPPPPPQEKNYPTLKSGVRIDSQPAIRSSITSLREEGDNLKLQ